MNAPTRLGMLNVKGVPHRGNAPISGVYSLTNVVSGCRYVGSSIDIAQRWAGHRAAFRGGSVCVNQRLGVALQVDGIDAFAVDLLEVVEPDDTALEAAEQRWIEHYASTGRAALYNIILSGRREAVKARRPRPRRAEGSEG